MAHPPSAELVTVAWLKTLPGIPPGGVATNLPADPATWSTLGFVQVIVVGGSPAVHTPMRGPVMQVSCWANAVNSSKAPWGKASTLAENVVAGCYADLGPVLLTMPDGFSNARLFTAWPLAEPRRIPDDEAGYARVDVDVALHWVVLP